jgi:uroporphyrin-III C-methyltransferase
MISLAELGQTVVRLKGGDPFLFGRGGEEVLALKAAGIAYQVVSGVTSGIAVPASHGIPVTHRAYTHGVTFVAGHTQDGRQANWQALVATQTTLVIYMGMKHLAEIVKNLLAAGMDESMPCIAIQHGTLQTERHVKASLAHLPLAVKQENLGSPAIVVIGEVVRLANSECLLDELEIAA